MIESPARGPKSIALPLTNLLPFLLFLFFLLLSLSVSLCPRAEADDNGSNGGGGGIVPFGPNTTTTLGMILTRSIPTVPLKKDLKLLKAAPGYLSFERSAIASGNHYSEKNTGWGLSVSYTKANSSHWGWGVVAGYLKTKGDISLEVSQAGGAKATGPNSDMGAVVCANIIYDPFDENHIFRLPLLWGLPIIYAKGTRGPLPFTYVDIGGTRNGHSGQLEESYKWGGPGYFFGGAPQWSAGDFRLVTYFYLTGPFSKTGNDFSERDLSNGSSSSTEYKSTYNLSTGGGLEVLYVPWNLGLTYSPTFLNNPGRSGEKASAYIVAFSHRFDE